MRETDREEAGIFRNSYQWWEVYDDAPRTRFISAAVNFGSYRRDERDS